MNLPTLKLRRTGGGGNAKSPGANHDGPAFDEHMEESRLAQRQADKWLISGSPLIGTAALGIFGLPIFLRGVWLLRRAQREGCRFGP